MRETMMKRFTLVLMIVSWIWCHAPRTSRADEGKPFDLQAFIDNAVRSETRRIVVPPGKYRVTPRNRQHLLLQRLENLEIVADGVELICTQTTRALTIADCRHVSLRGLTIDYDPLPFTQGRITTISADKKTHEIELFEGYPSSEAVQTFKYEIFRPDTRTLRCPDYDYTVRKLDPRHIHVVKKSSREEDPEQVGDIIVIGAESAVGGSIPHAVSVERCVGVTLENIDLFASNCFGFIEEDCDGSTYLHCRIDRRPASTDIVRRADARIRSLNADAFHCTGAVKGPAYLGCVARFMGDDAVNIHGSYHMITESHGNTLRLLAKGKPPQVGEPVELLSYEGRRLPDAVVTKVQPDGKINATEREFLRRQQMDHGLRTRWNPSAFQVTVDRDLNLPTGSLICSTRRIGNGFRVQDCDFGFNRSRGILIKASNGEVVGNTLTGSWMHAILVAPEYWWLEAGSSSDVSIRRNVIKNCRATAITVQARGGPGDVAPAGAHHDITISDNTVIDSPMPNIEITSTVNGSILQNTFVQPAPAESDPSKSSNRATLENAIKIMECKDMTVRDNSISQGSS